MKRVLFIIAQKDFRDEELKNPKRVLEKRGYKVEVASRTTGEAVGKFGMKIKPDLAMQKAAFNLKYYRAVVFVGGSGAKTYFNNDLALTIAKKANEAGKVVAAICLAPIILANAGILKGINATVFNGKYADMLKNGGAKYHDKAVIVDRNIVTANGPKAAEKFGKAIAKLMEELK